MPRKTKDAPGRATPKKTATRRAPAASGRAAPAPPSGRYTPPIPREFRSSPWWVPALIVAFFVGGIGVILINYLSVFWSASNAYLFVGLGLIVLGFITSTRWH